MALPDAQSASRDAAPGKGDPGSALRTRERWVILGALAMLAGVIFLALYAVRVLSVRFERDGVLTAAEATYLVRTKALVGLSIGEAQDLIDAPLQAEAQGIRGVAPISDRPGASLWLTIKDGRVTDARIEDTPAP